MKRVLSAAILGASDGSFTGLGLVLALVAGLSMGGMLHAARTTAVAGTFSMALGELVSDNDNGWREAASMGLSWLALCALPVLTAWAGVWELIPAEFMVLGVAMAWARSRVITVRGLLLVYAVMAGVAVPTVISAFT